MKIIDPYIIVDSDLNGEDILKTIEKFGRVCYKSEEKITEDSAKQFVSNILKSGHESVIEHCCISVKIICDRGVSHEIVRHRIASYSQESTRYCNYAKEKFGNELTFIKPCFWDDMSESSKVKMKIWEKQMLNIEMEYLNLLALGSKPEEARSILPNSLKTEIVVTMNLREWRHFLKLRTSIKAHPQMRQISLIILNEFKSNIPVLFEGIN